MVLLKHRFMNATNLNAQKRTAGLKAWHNFSGILGVGSVVSGEEIQPKYTRWADKLPEWPLKRSYDIFDLPILWRKTGDLGILLY